MSGRTTCKKVRLFGKQITLCFGVVFLLLPGCNNNPYRKGETAEKTYFISIPSPPSQLDPATAYYSHEGRIIDQIYEPVFTYHYLKRPYELIPQTAREVPTPVYYDKDGNRIEAEDPPAAQVARAEYTIRLKPGIMYQNHPCFATNSAGEHIYANVSARDIRDFKYPSEFEFQGTRELVAADYVLQIRRMADPRMASPIFSTLSRYIMGYSELHDKYQVLIDTEREHRREESGAAYSQQKDEALNPVKLHYLEPECEGVELVDKYTFKIVLKRKYPQIRYWLCMHFLSAMPQEALDFYNQPEMIKRQFTINRCPVGTGPYYMEVYRPSEVIKLRRNPNYHEDYYPSEGEPGDEAAGLLEDAGKRIPFIDLQVIRIEKEAISHWNKFLQGYYDLAGIGADVFDQAIQMQSGQDATLTDDMEKKGIRLITSVRTQFWYVMFNMRDEHHVVNGLDENKCKLRQAISIVLDYNEYLDIFTNGRGLISPSPIPPGIFGHIDGADGINKYVDDWDSTQKKAVSKSIETARRLMTEAGYPDGRNQDGKPLTLYYDHSQSGQPTFKSLLDWMKKRLNMIGIRLKERPSDLSRYRQKLLDGNWQVSSGGWLADYPDPENFLFLFYGPNSKAVCGGANSSNYSNPEFDRLFLKMESMSSGPERMEIIKRAVKILQHDAPMVWTYFPEDYILCHSWYKNVKPHQMSYNTMRYKRIDADLRTRMQKEWNAPIYQPIVLLILLLIGIILPVAINNYKRERGL